MTDVAPRPIVHVVASGGLYGIERTLTMLLPELRSRGWPAELLCLNTVGTAEAELGVRCTKLGIPVSYLPLVRGVNFRDLRRIWQTLRAMRPALVQVHGYKAIILVGLLARAQRIPVIGTVHSEAASAPHVPRQLRAEAQALKHLTRVVAVSAGVAADVARRGVPQNRIDVVRNGIADPGVPTSTGAPVTTIVIIGRLVEPKNTHVALHALSILAERGLRPQLVIAGDGPERDALDTLAESLGVSGQVRFTGFVDDVRPLLTSDSVFVMPSRSEGIPIALLEAMAHGLPIVASRVGGIPEVVRDGTEALLVPTDDAPALAAALTAVLGDAALARSLGAAGRARYEADFRASAMAERYALVYRTLLGSH